MPRISDSDLASPAHFSTLKQHIDPVTLAPLKGDAGTRTYHRFSIDDHHLVLADYGSAKMDMASFITCAEHFSAADLPIPRIWMVDHQNGYIVQTDLGDTTLYTQCQNGTKPCHVSYQLALAVLQQLQTATTLTPVLPHYDAQALREELGLFETWYCEALCQQPLTTREQTLWSTRCEHLVANMLAQPQVPVHRDFHSRNLMIHDNTMVMIDFQDSVMGPISYDIMSLVYDCYIDLPPDFKKNCLATHFQSLQAHGLIPSQIGWEAYITWCQHSAIQRLLKILGIFARLGLRDHKTAFLNDLILTHRHLHSLLQTCPALADLTTLLHTRAPEAAVATHTGQHHD